MSDSMRSPLEHGELEASPYHSPDIEIGVAGDSYLSDEGSNEDINPRHDDEEDLGPAIKPPQAKVKKDKHKHKHKYDKKKSDRDKGSKHKSSGADGGRSKEQKEHGGKARRSGGDPSDDRRVRHSRLREEELDRREKSLKERERLEKLELERRRLDREISRREKEQHDKLQREKERERDRVDRVERGRGKQGERRPQTRHDVQSRRGRDQPYGGRSRSPHTRKEDQDRWYRAEQTDDRPRSRPSSKQSAAAEPPTPAPAASNKQQRGDKNDKKAADKTDKTAVDKKEASSEDSDSGSSSSDDSDSESDSSSAEEGSTIKKKSKEQGQDPLLSKFDSGSEHLDSHSDSEHDSGHHSDQALDQGNYEYTEYLDDSPPQSPLELKPDLPPYFPAIQGCRNVEEFNCLNRIEEGTYGVVYRAKDKKTDEIVALKRLKMEKEKDGFPITSLREINTLLKAQHPNIVTVREIVVGSNMDRIYIVMDYVEHDLKALMECMKEPFMIGEVKTLMIQLMRGVAHLHDNWIIHRDLKTSNLLLSHAGILKIGDFGLAREYGSPLKQYTPIVVTLWYRSPELLLGTKEYSCPIDVWSVGCIMAEFLTRKPLFPGKSEIDELNKIFKELGTPNEKIWPGVSELKGWKTCTFADYPYNQLRNRFGGIITDKGFELMNRFLTYNPSRRITAEEGLKHEWFDEAPKAIHPSMFPTWPAKSEQSHHKNKTGNSPKPPSGGKAYSSLLNDEDEKLGFHLPGVAAGGGGGFSLRF